MKTRMQTGQGTASLTLAVDPKTNRIPSSNTAALAWDPAGDLTKDPTLFGE